jgi:hypothetical protein
MQTVTVTRTVPAPPDAVREAMMDHAAFMRAGGFDGVDVSGDTIHLMNRLGILTIELDLELVESDAAFVYEQREGMFETMRTEFALEAVDEGTEVTATTEFALDVSVVGDFLDGTVIKRQRRKELEGQLDYLEEASQSTT